MNFGRDVVEIGPDHVHLVDEDEPGHPIFVGLVPHGFRLRFDALLSVEDHHGPVQHAQAPLDFGGEVDVARRVDEIDGAVSPLERNAGTIDRDAAFLLFGVIIGFGGAGIDGAEPVLGAGVVKQVLRGRGLAGIDMRNDAEVANLVELVAFGRRHKNPSAEYRVLGPESKTEDTAAFRVFYSALSTRHSIL